MFEIDSISYLRKVIFSIPLTDPQSNQYKSFVDAVSMENN